MRCTSVTSATTTNTQNGRFIDPTTDKNAIKTNKGDWMCGTCVEDLYKMNQSKKGI